MYSLTTKVEATINLNAKLLKRDRELNMSVEAKHVKFAITFQWFAYKF